MDTNLSFNRMAELSEAELAAIRALSLVVYPLEIWADWPGFRIEWTQAEWCVRIVAQGGELLSYTGIVTRQATHDGQPVKVGGICGVKTHPPSRGQGFASRSIRQAVEFFHEQGDVDFALLVCEPHLLDYYGRLGWQPLNGRLLVSQHGVQEQFTFLRVMVQAVQSPAPTGGVFDLCGPPW